MGSWPGADWRPGRSTARGSRGRTACLRRRRASSRRSSLSSTVMTPSLPTFSIASASLLADLRVAVGADGADLRDLLRILGRLRHLLQRLDDGLDGLVDAALDLHRVVARRDELRALAVDRLREHGRGGRAVAGDVARLRRDLAHHLRAHVLEAVLELDLLGDGDAVLGDRRRAEALLDDDVAALGAERDLDRVGERVDAGEDQVARASRCRRFLWQPC